MTPPRRYTWEYKNSTSFSWALTATDAPGHPPVVVLGLFSHDTKYFDPSTRDVMINFAVDDLDAMLK